MMKVFIADDHKVLIDGLVVLLETEGYTIAGTATNGIDTVAWFTENTCDVLILDITMKNGDGFFVLENLKQLNIPHKTVMLTSHLDEFFVKQTIKLGALGYVLKDDAFKHICKAINHVANNEHYYSEKIEGLTSTENTSEDNYLSKTQIDILNLMCNEDLKATEVAEKLNMSPSTCRTHTQRAKRKLKAKTPAGMASRFKNLYKF